MVPLALPRMPVYLGQLDGAAGMKVLPVDTSRLQLALTDLNDFLHRLDSAPPPAIQSAIRSLATRAETLLTNRDSFFLSDKKYQAEEMAIISGLTTLRVTMAEIMGHVVSSELLVRMETPLSSPAL